MRPSDPNGSYPARTAFPPLHRLAVALADRAADATVGPRGCLLTFHRVAPAASWATRPDRDFYVDLDFLDALLGHLARTGWDVVTIEEALRRLSGPAREAGRFVNFSIDDTYRDTWELAVPLFRRHGVPLTLFVTTGIPDGGYLLWYSGLDTVLGERDTVIVREDGRATTLAVAEPAAKQAAFRALSTRWDAGDAAASWREFCADNETSPEAVHAAISCDWDMLRSFAGDACVEIGGHTVTHPRISSLSDDAALAELAGCRTRLEAMLDRPVRHFAFPFGRGRDCGPRDFAIARQAGFASAATTRKGLLRPGRENDPFSLPRCTLNGLQRTLPQVGLHLSGASAAAARMLGRV